MGSAHLEPPTSSLMVGWWWPQAVGLYTDHGCHRETFSPEQMRGDGASRQHPREQALPTVGPMLKSSEETTVPRHVR